MTIPNRVSLLLVAGFFILAGFSGMPLADIAMHTGAGLTVLVIAFACFAFGWIGGATPRCGRTLVRLSSARQLSRLRVAVRRRADASDAPVPAVAIAPSRWFRRNLQRLHRKDSGIPYGIALALGALMIYPETEWMKAIDLTRFIGH
jgi:prepilin peptidase CpaA